MEPVDPELTDRLNAAAHGVDATPDLAAVLAGAGRHRRRQRTLGIGSAVAVVVLGVGGVVLVASRDTGELPSAQPVAVPLTTTTLATSDADATESAGTTLVDDVGQVLVETDSYYGDGYEYDPNAPDPAEPYLEQTTEIYRRWTPSGNDVQIRRSNVSYGELFGIEWDLPVGSQDACLGGDAVFIGNPDRPVQWLSTWRVSQWWPLDPTREIAIEEYSTGSGPGLIVRAALDAQQVAVVQNGEVGDQAEFVNGVAVVEMLPYSSGLYQNDDGGDPQLSVTVVGDSGNSEVRTFPVYGQYSGQQVAEPGCASPKFPGRQLPEPGPEQPADIGGAEQAVRDRHALLVDRTIDEKPADLLTDDTGIAEAQAQMDAGQYSESAAGAKYTIDGVVFTDATTAWFEYTIVAPTGTFSERFGQAVYNGQVWQITRQTICQDLSLALGYCDPGGSTSALEPPLADGVDLDVAIAEWEVLQNSFFEKLSCNPLNPCGDFDVRRQLPEPGEQPADPRDSEIEIAELMQSMYGAGQMADRLDRLDDATGVADALAQVAAEGMSDQAASSSVQVDELVFASPTAASFRYTLFVPGLTTLADRIGGAVRIDGEWRIQRTTVCTDLALAGGDCDA